MWKELGSVPKCGGDWVLYQCVEGIRFCTVCEGDLFCTSVLRRLVTVSVCGDWVLYQCVGEIRFCSSVSSLSTL